MGYTTDFVGQILVEPRLNDAEIEFLLPFSETRRWDREAGPYVVLDHPALGEAGDDLDRYNRPSPGEPSLWCHWRPCLDGHCLRVENGEKFYGATDWLRYVIEHFLQPGALCSRGPVSDFAGFTFDHRCAGAVAGCRRDTGLLYLIEVAGNQVRERVLMPGAPEVPYEQLADVLAAEDQAPGSGADAIVLSWPAVPARRGGRRRETLR